VLHLCLCVENNLVYCGLKFWYKGFLKISPPLTDDADDEGHEVDDAVQHLHVPLGFVPEDSVDQDGCGEEDYP